MLTDPISSTRLLHLKGWMFLLVCAGACALILAETPSVKVCILLAIAVWAGCRFYYFLFHVLEAYAGRGRPYSGLFDALRYALKGEPKRRG